MTRRLAFADLPPELLAAHESALSAAGYTVSCPDRKSALSLQRRLQRFAWRAAAEGPPPARAIPVWRVVELCGRNGRKSYALVGERSIVAKPRKADVLALLRGEEA